MGLDMYAYTMREENVGDRQTDIKLSKDAEQIAYWRKFNHLHGWMQDLYFEKGGQSDIFNCTTVRLNENDLAELETALREETLEHCPGFFFGDDEIYPENIQDTHEFIRNAREALKHGLVVLYDSWW